jgi:mannose-6-phosphate isomerase-like protein (cupin superfamily)
MEIFHDGIKRIARKNQSFRKVVSTTKHSQVIVMSLKPGEDVGEEIHVQDMMILVVKGSGQVVVEGMTSDLEKGDLVHLPGGTRHDAVASPDEAMKLVVIYSPPLHLESTEHATKADAMAEAAKDAAIALVPSAL